MSSEKVAPDWVFEGDSGMENSDFDHISDKEYKRMVSVESGVLSEAEIVRERESIEACASVGSIYYCSSNWSDNTRSALREYAMVCGLGMEKYQEVDPSKINVIAATAPRTIEASAQDRYHQIAQQAVRTAAAEPEPQPEEASMADALKSVLGDPFKLDSIAEERKTTPRRDDWETIEPEHKLASRPAMMSNNIIPIGGGEDYNTNSEVPLPKNQNSILDPDAIGKLAESKELDNGERIKQAVEEKKQEMANRNKVWEQDKVDKLSGAMLSSRGNVFLTESLNAQPGLNSPSSQMGVYSDFDAASIPERTEGEMIKAQNDQRRESIRGNRNKPEYEFEARKASTADISSVFADSLKKQLGK